MRERVTLAECRPGDVIDETIIDIRTGVVLCPKNFMLTKESIYWLKKFLTSDIYVYRNTLETVWQLSPELIKAYSSSKKRLSTLLYTSAKASKLDYKILQQIQENLFKVFNQNTLLVGCVNIVKGMDEVIYGHSMNVGVLAALIGKWLHFSEAEVEELFLAGILHDVGKYKIDRNLLYKGDTLTKEEAEIVRLHPIYSYKIIKDNEDINERIKQAVLCHHECIDGTGYPMGLREDRINLLTRIIAIADLYEGLLSKRVQDKSYTAFKVMKIMMNEEIDRLDTEILLEFLKTIANYYIGVQVKLNTGETGEVIFIHPNCIYRPIVKVEDKYIDLNKEMKIEIIEML